MPSAKPRCFWGKNTSKVERLSIVISVRKCQRVSPTPKMIAVYGATLLNRRGTIYDVVGQSYRAVQHILINDIRHIFAKFVPSLSPDQSRTSGRELVGFFFVSDFNVGVPKTYKWFVRLMWEEFEIGEASTRSTAQEAPVNSWAIPAYMCLSHGLFFQGR